MTCDGTFYQPLRRLQIFLFYELGSQKVSDSFSDLGVIIAIFINNTVLLIAVYVFTIEKNRYGPKKM